MPEKIWRSFRELSRVDYGAKVDPQNIESSVDDPVSKGAFLRIADALERLVTGKTELETQKELEAARAQLSAAKRDFEHERWLRRHHECQIRAYKGVITKLKGKAGAR